MNYKNGLDKRNEVKKIFGFPVFTIPYNIKQKKKDKIHRQRIAFVLYFSILYHPFPK